MAKLYTKSHELNFWCLCVVHALSMSSIFVILTLIALACVTQPSQFRMLLWQWLPWRAVEHYAAVWILLECCNFKVQFLWKWFLNGCLRSGENMTIDTKKNHTTFYLKVDLTSGIAKAASTLLCSTWNSWTSDFLGLGWNSQATSANKKQTQNTYFRLHPRVFPPSIHLLIV